LRAWHNSAKVDETRSVFDSLSYLFPSEIPSTREPLIRAQGASLTLDGIRKLFELCDRKPVLIGTIHGDLNATNVLTRAGDAIVIDFEQLAEGMPLVYDAACVEAGLLVDGFANDHRAVPDLLRSIDRLYSRQEIFEWVTQCHPKDSSTWFYDCVREIRVHARQFELRPGQYISALALAFIKKACNPYVFGDKRDELRAMGFVLAERLLRLITAQGDESVK
jgi:Ternary complex associated domain 9